MNKVMIWSANGGIGRALVAQLANRAWKGRVNE